jgi:holliday junction DNA helicase RuvB
MKLFGRWRKNNDNNIDISISERQAKSAAGQHLFDNIVGYEDVKTLYEMAVKAEKPVHLLLVGPPASAKSLFMSSLTKRERSYYAVGSSSTKSGIFDYLFEYRPRYFIIDEIEKMNERDQTSLLNLMESGILSELKTQSKKNDTTKNLGFCII